MDTPVSSANNTLCPAYSYLSACIRGTTLPVKTAKYKQWMQWIMLDAFSCLVWWVNLPSSKWWCDHLYLRWSPKSDHLYLRFFQDTTNCSNFQACEYNTYLLCVSEFPDFFLFYFSTPGRCHFLNVWMNESMSTSTTYAKDGIQRGETINWKLFCSLIT